jgi:hypothetical protein
MIRFVKFICDKIGCGLAVHAPFKGMKNIMHAVVPAILILVVFLPARLFSQADSQGYIQRLWAEINGTRSDSVKIEKLSALAFFYADYLGDRRIADSVSDLAVRLAEDSHRPELLFLAYSKYLESVDLHINYPEALGYALKAEQISFPGKSTEQIFVSYRNLVSVYLAGYDYDKSLMYGYKLLSLAGTTDDAGMKAAGYLCVGQSLEGKNQKIEAFRNYLNALAIADRTKNIALKGKCYDVLSNFYNFSKLYDKATRYKLMQRELIERKVPVDSVALLWTEYDLQVIDINSNHNQLYQGNMTDILGFATRHGHKRLLDYEIGLLRAHYIEDDNMAPLHDLYYRQFPSELTRLATANPSLFFRLKAFFSEADHRPDSAMWYFQKAEKIVQSDPNLILQSQFYNRYGQFLQRNGQQKKAVETFLKSLELARTASYIDYIQRAVCQLESIYAAEGDYRNAYVYSVMNKALGDSLQNMSKKDQLLIMEIEHETRQRDLETEQEKQSTTRRHYLQYTGMLIGILTVFVVLIMLGSLKIPEWIIRMLGFFSFIFLFEFIILLADNKIHDITHGEPWKVLLIKIFLIAILLPLHHGIEKRVITYLLNHKLLALARHSVVKMLLKTSFHFKNGGV